MIDKVIIYSGFECFFLVSYGWSYMDYSSF